MSEADASAEDLGPTTEDAFLDGAVRIRQPARGYRAGLDAVLLAAAAPLVPGRRERLLDVGAGVGTVGLCVARRVGDADVTLVERDPQLAALARRNVDLNGFGQRCRVIALDISGRGIDLQASGLQPHGFAHVVANPPFHDTEGGTLAGDPRKARAHAMPADSLEVWVRFMARMAAAGGTATLIHKVEMLGPLIAALEGRFGALRVLPVHPRPGATAVRVLVQGVRGSKAPLSLLAPLVLHGPHGHAFTAEVSAILRDGAPLALVPG